MLSIGMENRPVNPFGLLAIVGIAAGTDAIFRYGRKAAIRQAGRRERDELLSTWGERASEPTVILPLRSMVEMTGRPWRKFD